MMGIGYYIFGQFHFFGNIVQLQLSSVTMTVGLYALVNMQTV